MKQFFLLLVFAVFATAGAFAQKSCSATCTKSAQATCAKGAKASATAAAIPMGSKADEMAAVAVRQNPDVERRVNTEARTVSYVRKNVCATSGTVSYADVEYCTKSKKFVNVSPTAMAAAAAKPACCASKATCKTSCADCAKGKPCGKCTKSADAATEGKVKLVKE